MDGGIRAARGFRYQYLKTLHSLLDFISLEGSENYGAHIEGSSDASIREEAVDYDISNNQGHVIRLVQVKSRESSVMQPGEILEIFLRLSEAGDSPEYALETNAEISKATQHHWQLIATLPMIQKHEILREITKRNSRLAKKVAALSDEHVARLARCRLILDQRSMETLSESLIERISVYRSRGKLGGAQRISEMLASMLLAQVFTKASSPANRRLQITTLQSILEADNLSMAAVAGKYTWGMPIGPCPVKNPDIVRDDLLHPIEALLVPSSPSRVVKSSVITGASGMGKSSLAASFISRHLNDYDLIVWMNGSTSDSLRRGALELFEVIAPELDMSRASGLDQVQQKLREVLSGLAGRWLIVFDNVRQSRDLHPWLPTEGHGSIIVTSTNQSGWQSYSSTLSIDPMSISQAERLIANRLQLAIHEISKDERNDLRELVEAVAGWPLALELAAGYLNSTQQGLRGAGSYLRRIRLHVLADSDNLPPDYPHSLVSAIFMALGGLEDLVPIGPDRFVHFLFLATCAYLSPQEIPSELVLGASLELPHDEFEFLLKEGPNDNQKRQLDRLIKNLRSFSLVQREQRQVLPIGGFSEISPTLDLLAMNEIVQEVIRLNLPNLEGSEFFSLKHAAAFASTAIAGATELGNLHLLAILEPHAVTILDHAMIRGVRSQGIATLIGNLGAERLARGFATEALQLCKLERSLLDTQWDVKWGSPSLLNAQLCTVEFNAHLQANSKTEEVAECVSRLLTGLETMPDFDAASFEGGTKICLSLAATLAVLSERRPELSADHFLSRLERIKSRFPGETADILHMDLMALSVNVGYEPELVRFKLTELESKIRVHGSPNQRLSALLIWGEIHVRSREYAAYARFLELVEEICLQQPFFGAEVIEKLLNCGTVLVIPYGSHHALLPSGIRLQLARETMRVVNDLMVRTDPDHYDSQRSKVIAAFVDIADQNYESARQNLTAHNWTPSRQSWTVKNTELLANFLAIGRHLLDICDGTGAVAWCEPSMRRSVIAASVGRSAVLVDLLIEDPQALTWWSKRRTWYADKHGCITRSVQSIEWRSLEDWGLLTMTIRSTPIATLSIPESVLTLIFHTADVKKFMTRLTDAHKEGLEVLFSLVSSQEYKDRKNFRLPWSKIDVEYLRDDTVADIETLLGHGG